MLSSHCCCHAVQAEALARAQFIQRRDAHDCCLMYLALGKKGLLAGLFRQVGAASFSSLVFQAGCCSQGEARGIVFCAKEQPGCLSWSVQCAFVQRSNPVVLAGLSNVLLFKGATRLPQLVCPMCRPCPQGSNSRVAEFLGRDFSQEAQKRAAAKNAFALLGQHRWGGALECNSVQ